MATNVTQFFSATAQTTSTTYINSFSPTGFTIGTAVDVNTSAKTYWFAAFKDVAGLMNVGSFIGTGTATSTTGMGFQPNFVMYKSSAAQGPGYELTQSDGDDSSLFTDTKDTPGNITSLDSDGFSVGTTAGANGSGATIYWAGFGGDVPASASASGTFLEADGSYTGNGTGQSITGLGFSPDLVFVGTAGQDEAFRTSEMNGDDTAVFSKATADFTGGITTLDSDGFSVGTVSSTNLNGSTYYWIAFGNAWSQETHTGSAEFVVGAYTGNGIARSILNLPFAPDFVLTKSESTQGANWTTSLMSPGTTQFLSALAQNTAGAEFTSLNTNSFSLGINANANKAGTVYNWFAFKDDQRFATGNYTGNGTGQTVTGLGFQPDLVWTKRTTAVNAAMTFSSVPAGTSLVFGVSANSTVDIINLTGDGFTVGTGAESNAAGGSYWYAAWTGKEYNQSAYRLFTNQNSADVGSPLAAQNATATLSSTGSPFRLRMLIQLSNDTLFPSGRQFNLQFASSTSCSSATYSDVTTSTAIAFYHNSVPTDGGALTADANDPINGTDVVDNQTYDESNPFTNSQSAIGNGEDGKWDFSLFDNGAPANTPYCFRATRVDGSPLDAYTVYPGIVTASAASNPSLSNTSLNNSSAITLTPNTTTAISVTASTTAGSYPISFATSTIYRTSLGSGCAANNLDCYQVASASCSFSGSTTTVACSAPLWYFAQSTGNPSSSYPADSWKGAITITDSHGNTTTASSAIENVNVLTAINITTSSINYGKLNPNTNSGATDQTVTVQNAGNSSTTLQLSGTAFVKGASTIATSSQHYATSTFTFGGLEQQLSGTLTTVSGFTLPSPTSTTAVQGNIFWGVGVPSGVATGTYTASTTFSAAFSQ